MELSFDLLHQVIGGSPKQAMEDAACLLKDYLMAGTRLTFGRKADHWFWHIKLPNNFTPLPSAVTVLTIKQLSDQPEAKRVGTWYALHNRVTGKDALIPFNRTIKQVMDVPLEALFRCVLSDFTICIEIPGKMESMPGLKDSAMKVFIMGDNETVVSRLGQWLDCRTYPLDNRHSEAVNCLVGLSEIHYLIRVPIFSDALLAHLQDVPSDVVDFVERYPDALRRNLLVCGLPGSGKTTTVKAIIAKVLQKKSLQSLLIADVKGEYEDWCKTHGVSYLAPGKNPACLQQLGINLFIPSANLRLATHIELMAVLLTIGGFGGGGLLLPSYFKILLEEWYIAFLLPKIRTTDWSGDLPDHRLQLLNLTGIELIEKLNGDINCFNQANRGLLNFWHTHSKVFIDRVFGHLGQSNGRLEVLDVITSRMAAFETSILQSFCFVNGNSIDLLLTQRLCLGLNGLSKANIQLLMSIFYLLCFESLMAGHDKNQLEHLFLIEESHLVAAQTGSFGEIFTIEKLVGETIERALCEARSKGVGLVLTDQQPGTRLLSSVLANTNMKVCHNLLGKDAELIAQSMGLPPETNFSDLGVGMAYVKMGDHWSPVRSRIRLW